MPRRRVSSDESKLKQGRGSGHGKDYKPFLTVREVPSKGLRSREPGWKTERAQHLLANTEDKCFFVFDWSEEILDIREQFPLPQPDTISIAERLGIKHPVIPGTTSLAVMTTDFLLDVIKNGKVVQVARSVKLEEDLSNSRAIEKQEIERTFWKERGIDWGIIVTDREFPEYLAKNIIWCHADLNIKNAPSDISEDIVNQLDDYILERIKSEPNIKLSHIALSIDKELGFKNGTTLWVVKHLIANKRYCVDMYKLINPTSPIVINKRIISQSELSND